jgi:hypothetical protein
MIRSAYRSRKASRWRPRGYAGRGIAVFSAEWSREEGVMGIWEMWPWLVYGCTGIVAIGTAATYLVRLLDRTWFDPVWKATRRQRLLNDPLYEDAWWET